MSCTFLPPKSQPYTKLLAKCPICLVEAYLGANNPYAFVFPSNAEVRAKMCLPTEGTPKTKWFH